MIPIFLLTIEDPEQQSVYVDAYTRYSQQLMAIASLVLYGKVSICEDEQTQARDVVHDAFQYVLEKRNLPKDLDQAKALLITITKHIAIDYVRKNRHMADYEPAEVQLGYTLPEESGTLSYIVDGLPDIYKEVLILYYEYGYKAKEIAAMLNTNTNTILKRLERARGLAKEEYYKTNERSKL